VQWSFKIATIFGIPIKVHFTFLLLVFLIGMTPHGFQLSEAILIVLVFLCVLLHELGHSLLAMKYGLEVESITLLPIGGVAAMKTLPKTAKAELLIALAGPAVSAALGLIFLGLAGRHNMSGLIGQRQSIFHLPGELSAINFFLAAFNLLPAFPMDGGRVLRAILWPRKGFARATNIAVKIGQGLSIIFFMGALLTSNVNLVLIALFIYFGAEAEGRLTAWRDVLADLSVADAMFHPVAVLCPEQTIQDAFQLMLSSGQDHFPVLAGEDPVGLLTRPVIVQAMREQQGARAVSDFMSNQLIYCKPFDNLSTVLRLMDKRNLPCVWVLYEDRIVGLVTPELVWRLKKS